MYVCMARESVGLLVFFFFSSCGFLGKVISVEIQRTVAVVWDLGELWSVIFTLRAVAVFLATYKFETSL